MIPRPQVRPMVATDLERVLGWRNHPEVRRHMYTQHAITPQSTSNGLNMP